MPGFDNSIVMGNRWNNAARYAAFLLLVYVPTGAMVYAAANTTYRAVDVFSNFRFFSLLFFVPIFVKYVIHLVIAPWFPAVERYRGRGVRGDEKVPVSVLIACHNEEVGIAATLQSIVDTGYRYLEMIIVDDGSTDRTGERVQSFIAGQKYKEAEPGVRFVYIHTENKGKAAALNVALSHATGDIVITIDADSVVDQKVIEALVRYFHDPLVASVAGQVVIGNKSRPLGIIQQLEYLYGFYFKQADSIMNAVYIVGGAAAAYRRAVIIRLGGYDEHMVTEDIELSTRLQDHGYRVRYAPDAIVYTEGPSDFVGLCRQRLRWKYGRLLTFHKYRHLFFSLDKRHNRYLTFFVLPLAVLAEGLLMMEFIFLGIFILYTVMTNDFMPLVFVIGLLAAVVALQIMTDANARYHKNLLLLAPGTWIIFYIMDMIEFQALIRSLWKLITGQKFKWQKWNRVGVFHSGR